MIFASGSGSNAENIIRYFQQQKTAVVSHVLCNRENAGVLARAKRLKIPFTVFNKTDFFDTETILNLLQKKADCIVLAGFLWKVPTKIVEAFPRKIINIHPALLPKYGGKGMYGMRVHKAVVANKETETGITIHYVNAQYDEGAIIFQEKTSVLPNDTPEIVAEKIHTLEHQNFPKVIEKLVQSL